MKWLDSIFKRWKKPEREPQAEPERFGVRSYAAQTSTAAGAITPERLASIIKNAESGDITSQCELFVEMEKRDGELLGLIGQRKAGVLACKTEIQPGDEKDPRSVKAQEFVQQVMADLNSIEDGDNLQDNQFDLLDAIPKGFSCLEVKWETSESQWWPTRLDFRPQQWWTVDETDHNKLLLRDNANWKGREVNPLNFIIHRHRAMSGALTQSGISLACSRPFVVRNYGLKDWLVMAELFGVPTRIGTLPQGASEADKALMLAALKNLGAAAYGVKPAGSEIEFVEAAGKSASSDLYDRLLSTMYRWYQMALLGQTLTSGGEAGGSYELGRVHQNVRFDLIDSDARRADRRWSAFYARLTRLNFGADVAPPVHRTVVEEPKNLQGLATVVQTLVNAGVPVPTSWARATFNIPEPQEDEEILEPPQPAGPFGSLTMPNSASAVSAQSAAQKKKPALPPAELLSLQRLALSGRYLT